MKLQPQKDFLIRPLKLSDQLELVELIQKYSETAEAAQEFQNKIKTGLTDSQTLFKVGINSNGVIISFLWCQKNEWKALVFNPNFKKAELKTAMLEEARQWAAKQTPEGTLTAKEKLIRGDLKAFLKKQGIKIEEAPANTPNGYELLRF